MHEAAWNARAIPTPADCAKWEALREAAQKAAAVLSDPMSTYREGEQAAGAVTAALAALDAPTGEVG
ncbi:MAG: hypothetical protein ACLGSA_12735 [Acidobacteriota bacterium]